MNHGSATGGKSTLSVDPPPDVVLEMEMSRSARDKLPLFASMGIPEVWRCDGQRVYDLHPRSESLPGVILTVWPFPS